MPSFHSSAQKHFIEGISASNYPIVKPREHLRVWATRVRNSHRHFAVLRFMRVINVDKPAVLYPAPIHLGIFRERPIMQKKPQLANCLKFRKEYCRRARWTRSADSARCDKGPVKNANSNHCFLVEGRDELLARILYCTVCYIVVVGLISRRHEDQPRNKCHRRHIPQEGMLILIPECILNSSCTVCRCYGSS